MTSKFLQVLAVGVWALMAPAAWAQQAGGHEAHATPAAPRPSPVSGGSMTVASADEHSGHAPLYFGAVLFDQLEMRSNGRGNPLFAWEGLGYYGSDYHRIWVNARGETNRDRGGLERAEVQALYSRLVGYYWDVQAGVRHDFQIDPRQGTPSRTYGVFGLQGLAPGFFEVQLHGFVSERGTLLARAAASYDLLITNRLILQPEAELNFAAGRDSDALIAPGLYRVEAGLRLRYEITREFAPYIGYSYESYTGGAAGLNRRLGEKPSQSTVVAGIRLFF
ncbi:MULTISPECIES: copper resistance protein B [Roseicella]|uniref:Copper resistance protein B n=1 Tax=Roseicella aquatilis TaxID=2527868 RepID=A0A4R4D630_9PROT|nr:MULTISPECIES: copper resistance protein B [Roseicella]NOG73567.1 copper resistance protein B [Roseicella sp. DB1501]TCZ55810.1 copper resistance protein B [Roseicella aquatilis]